MIGNTPSPRVHRLRSDWRIALLFIGALGVGALAIGLAGLLDLPFDALRDEATRPFEHWIAIAGGLLLLAFVASALRHARAAVSGGALRFLAFGPVCRTAVVPLDEITRFGHGRESRGYQAYEVLLLELRDGTRRSVKVSIFEDWRELVADVARGTGLTPAQTEDRRGGVRFVEPRRDP